MIIDNFLKFISLFFILFFLLVFQTQLTVWGARPNLVLIFLIFIIFFRNLNWLFFSVFLILFFGVYFFLLEGFWLESLLFMYFLLFLLYFLKNYLIGNQFLNFIFTLMIINILFHFGLSYIKQLNIDWFLILKEGCYNLILGFLVYLVYFYEKKKENYLRRGFDG